MRLATVTLKRMMWFGLLLVATISLPKKIASVDHRGVTTRLVFKLQKANPPFAAFEDSRDLENGPSDSRKMKEDGEALFNEKKSTSLVAGEVFDLEKLKQEDIEVAVSSSIVADNRRLKGMVFKRAATTDTVVSGIQNQRKDSREVSSIEFERPAPIYTTSGKLKSLKERKEILAAHFATTFNQPTVDEREQKEKTEALIAQAATESRVAANTREFVASTGTKVIVKRTNNSPIKPSDSRSSSPQVAPEVDNLARDGADFVRRAVASHQSEKTEDPSVAGIITDPEGDRGYSYVIHGDLEMRDGLAYTGVDTFLRVVHIQGGYLQNEGVVWASEGRFEIVVDKVEGYLIGELRSSEGELLGYSELGLDSIKNIDAKSNEIKDVHLVIRPAPKGLMVEVSSARSFEGNEFRLDNVDLSIDAMERRIHERKKGQYIDDSLSADSSFVLKAEKEGYWNSLAIREAQSHEKMVMFPDSMIEALISLSVKESTNSENEYGVVWGRVLDAGNPVKDAKVAMVGEGYVGPIYFTKYIPDQTLKSTSENGLFAFVRVVPGIQSIEVAAHGKRFLAEVFPVGAKAVSQIDIKSLRTRNVTVSLYDGFNGEAKPGKIQVIGSSREIFVEKQKSKEVVLPGGSGVMIVEADAGKTYEVSRVTTKKSAYHIKFPFVTTAWLEKLVKQANLEMNPDLGKVVGFNKLSYKDVFIDGGYGTNSSQVIYFDKKGRYLQPSQWSQSAGFLFINVPIGYRTLTAHSEETGLTSVQVLITAPGAVNVATFEE